MNEELVSTDDFYTFHTNYESAGNYIINVSVTDEEYYAYYEWLLAVRNTNRLPSAVITSPLPNTKFKANEEIYFSAEDSFDLDNEPLSYSWSSDIDGTLSNNKSFYRKLSAGTHLITLTVTDGTDTNYEQITIIVEELAREEGWRFIPWFEAFWLLAIVSIYASFLRKYRQKKFCNL
jgi:hypothetical protein